MNLPIGLNPNAKLKLTLSQQKYPRHNARIMETPESHGPTYTYTLYYLHRT